MIEQEEMASGSARRDLVWILERISSLLGERKMGNLLPSLLSPVHVQCSWTVRILVVKSYHTAYFPVWFWFCFSVGL